MMKFRLLGVIFLCLMASMAVAQTDTTAKPTFGTPVFVEKNNLLQDLKRVLDISPSAKKDSVWGAFEGAYRSLPEGQHEKLFELAKVMHKRTYLSNPHFEDLLACLASPKLSIESKDAFLSVMDTTARKYPRYVGGNFLNMTRIFLEQKMLHKDAFSQLMIEGGEVTFGHVYDEALAKQAGTLEDPDKAIDAKKEEWFSHLEEEKKKAEEEAAKEEPAKEEPKDDDGWGDDGWDTTDDSDTTSSDGWGSDSGGWGSDSGGGWGSDSGWDDGWGGGSGWGSPEEEEAKRKAEEEEAKKRLEAERKERLKMKKPERPKALRIEPNAGEMPPVTGPFLKIANANFVMQSKYDTFRIEGTEGAIMGKNKVFVGKGGRFDWRGVGLPANDPYAEFGEYTFNAKAGRIEAGDVSFYYPSRIDSLVKGEFRYTPVPKSKYAPPVFPRFISYNNDVVLKNVAEGVDYEGGFMLKGNQIFGQSIQGGPSSIVVSKNGEKRFKATSTQGFQIGDSLITNPLASIVVFQGQDSLMHDALQLRYEPKTGMLKGRQDRKAYREAPYYHTYHKMELRGDYLSWDVNTDSVNLRMLDSKIPLTLESRDYFDISKFSKAQGILRFHPLVMAYGYAKQVRSWGFFSADMAKANNMNPAVVRGAMIDMQKKGFLDYDQKTDWVEVERKTVFYSRANLRQADFDHILVYSYKPGQQNITLDMQHNDLLVRGVGSFMLTDVESEKDEEQIAKEIEEQKATTQAQKDKIRMEKNTLQVRVTPKNQEITIKKDRDTQFSGKMKAGNFVFEGSNFLFEYDTFFVQMDTIDRLAFMVKDTVTGELVELENGMVETSGLLYILQPNNKSGVRMRYDDYPKFDTEKGGKFMFGGDEILGGAYKADTTFFFDVPPFDIDSLNSSDPSKINFDGTFHSGGIFPPFEEKLKVMPDRSFGFERGTPENGFSIYEAKLKEQATYYNKIRLDNKGLRGDGRIEYLSGVFYSPDFIFYPDSVTTTEGVNSQIAPGFYKHASYPLVKMPSYRMRWMVNTDSMLLSNPADKPFTVYDDATTFDGTLALSPLRLSGDGKFETSTSITQSKSFAFGETNFISRNSTFQIKSKDPKKPALLGERVKVFYNLADRYADISAEKEGDDIFSFPYMAYRTSLSYGRWDFDDQAVAVKSEVLDTYGRDNFFCTDPAQGGLSFYAKSAVYDISKQLLKIDSVSGIMVGNVRVLPKDGKVTVQEGGDMDQLKGATIELPKNPKNHILTDADIRITSRLLPFTGSAKYVYRNTAGDTSLIQIDHFGLIVNKEERGKRVDTTFTSTAETQIAEDTRMVIMPGILYKGKFKLWDAKKMPEFDGAVSLDLDRPGNSWFAYKYDPPAHDTDTLMGIYIDDKITQLGFTAPLVSGLYLTRQSKSLYGPMLELRKEGKDMPIFMAQGKLVYDKAKKDYTIAAPEKLKGESLVGNKFVYNHGRNSVDYEGVFHLLEEPKNMALKCSGFGNGNNARSEYFLNVMMALEFEYDAAAFEIMANDFAEETEGANTSEAVFAIKLAQFVDPKLYKRWRANQGTEEAVPVSEMMPASITLSEVELQWSEETKAFYSIGQIGIANIFKTDLDVRVDAHIEIPKREGNNLMYIHIENSKGTWYYLIYDDGDISILSNNTDFNNVVLAKASKSKVKLMKDSDENPGEPAFIFLDNMNQRYLGGEYPPKRKLPEEEKKKKKEEEPEKKDGF